MKIINEKGKLFGIINVVDLLVILIIVAVVGGVLWKFAGQAVTDYVSDDMEITYVIKVSDVDENFYDEVLKHLPAQLMTGSDYLSGYVQSVEKSQSFVKCTTADGQIVYSPNEGKIDMEFTLTAVVAKTSVNMAVGTQEVRTGIDMRVKTRYYEFLGVVMSVDVPQ